MAPPATKRRKLSHSGDIEDGEGTFREQGVGEPDSSDRSMADSGADSSDVSMDEPDRYEEVKALNDPSTSAHERFRHHAETPPGPKALESVRTQKRHDALPEDGVYTAETFKSNIFKLQVDELLEQVKPKYGKKEAPAEAAMRTLKSLIEQLPRRAPMSIADAEQCLKSDGVVIPFPSPRPPSDAKYKLQYERPHSINATGSYPLKTATRTDDLLGIDLVVTMPKSIFQEKDYLNHRYFYKRAYYLACLAAGIKELSESALKISFDRMHGNQLHPILVVEPSGDGRAADFSSSKCRIHIILAIPEGTFPEARLLPTVNCIRPNATGNDATKPLLPTPFYNSSLQSDATVTPYLKLLHAASGKCDAFKDACILGRIWLRQRGFSGHTRKGGFGNFEWAAVMALLLQPNTGAGKSPLSQGYSSYQLFKATLQFLAHHDLSKKPFVFQARDVTFSKSRNGPVFFDGPRGLNLLFKMTYWSYARLQLEAKVSIEALGNSVFDQFDATFILKTELLQYRYDAMVTLPLSGFALDPSSDDYEDKLDETCHKVYATVTRALTDRVTAINFSMPDTASWSISLPSPQESQHKRLLVNLATDPANANRTIDHGPAAENKQEAASFRKFWGDKAELRRFKDGSILESVVWSTKGTSVPVLQQIVMYILAKHLGAATVEKATFNGDAFAPLIASGRIQSQSAVSCFTPIMNAFATMEKDIRALEGLPLQIRHFRAADSQLRYSSVELPPYNPASVVLQFEGSARWPDDLCAIQRTKIAFLLKLAELLIAAKTEYVARVGLENLPQPSRNQAFLDITSSAGFTFRLRIHHDREATLLDRQLKDKSLDAPSRESAATALAFYKHAFLQIPSHTQAIQTLCTRYPALSPSIRLTKRWFASHLLSPHIAPEFIELLVVRTFLQPYPWPVPSCATSGFLRTLSWLSRWDWRHVPLIVDFSSAASGDATGTAASRGMKNDDIEQIRLRFEAWRRIDPAMNRVVLFAASNLDTDGNTWTDKGRPEKVVAARMTALARAATAAVRAEENRLLALVNGEPSTAEKSLVPESLFFSQLRDYDFVIHIAPKYTSSEASRSRPKYKNLELQRAGDAWKTAGPELARLFAEELRSVYGDAVLWFWDSSSLECIAGLFNPLVTGQRSWKVKAGWNSLPVKNEANRRSMENEEKEGAGVDIQINKAAILNEIRRIGGELIARIEVNR